MIFHDTDISGAKLIQLACSTDARGSFERVFCSEEFAGEGVAFTVVQTNLSINRAAGTLRGMHYQQAPYGEAKVVTCINGAIFDVVIDLRKDSPTFMRWQSFVLRAAEHRSLYVPKGLAHGFQTLMDDSRILYQMDRAYQPDAARGICYNDPAFCVHWPLPVSNISEKDRSYSLWNAEADGQ